MQVIEPTSSVKGVRAERIWALDFTKGMLVLFMVLYHWLNYFVGHEGYFYRYLRFLTPSFICISGFLISQVYISKYKSADARFSRRLIIRGLKILGIFVALNLIMELIAPRVTDGDVFFELLSPAALWSIFVSGHMGAGRLVAFSVLVPISYLLILSAILGSTLRYCKHVFHIATAVTITGSVIFELLGQEIPNLEMLSIGLLGISIGYIPIERVNICLRPPYLVLLAYLFYLGAISVWDVTYPLQVTGVLLSLALIYRVGMRSDRNGRIPESLILLGKYSLFGYIAQIAILQLLRRCLRPYVAEWTELSALALAITLTVIAVQCVDWARSEVPIANKVYNVIFS